MTSETKSNLDLAIRRLAQGDLEQVLALERQLFSDPWSQAAFAEQVEGANWGGFVAEVASRIIGYACYYIASDEAHLTNIAVAVDYRRKSVARQLLDNILKVATNHRCEFLLLEVRPSNAAAIAMYEKNSFKFLYRRPHYYNSPVEDALVMVRYLDYDEDE